jgi:cytochrome c2
MSDGPGDKSNERRGFLKKVAAVSGALPFTQGLGSGVALASLTAAQPAAAADAAAQVNAVVGYNSLSPDEAAFVEAMVNVMCPADDYTPNGVDCGLAIYKGIVGRKSGIFPGFRYSRALKNAGIIWDEKNLDAYLTDSQKLVPGNVMPFSGVADAKQRADLIAYLNTVK